jgi:signal transduction histidine kinase
MVKMKTDTSLEVTENHIPIGDAPFSVVARVAMQLGRESISNSIVAISELVKNAYDADAETVKIRFAGLDTGIPLLVIEDNGHGMTEKQLRDQWMVIGTPNKLRSAESPGKHRVLTGEKGLGRLGLDRLCKKTLVQAFVEEEGRGVELYINWEEYEDTTKRLEKVLHRLYSTPKLVKDPITRVAREIEKGTILILYDLKDAWTEELLLDLKRELTLLVSPFAGINDFSIEIDSGLKLDNIDGKVGSESMLHAAEWKLVSEIDEEGRVSRTMSSPQYETVFKTVPTPWNELFRPARDVMPQCGPLKFEMYFFPRKEIRLEDLSLSRAQVEEFLDSNQGIRIYRDGFRVKPYGEPDGRGDWLTLSYRRQQNPQGVRQRLGQWRVGYNQVVGAVFLGRNKNAALVDQTNRESIVEGPAFHDLRTFALEAVRFFELNRQRFELDREEQTDYQRAQAVAEASSQASNVAVEELVDATERIKALVAEVHASGSPTGLEKIGPLLETSVQKVSKTVSEAQEAQGELSRAADEQHEEFQRQKDTLGNLASLGILAISFGHETLASSNMVMINAQQLKRNMEAGLFMVLPKVQDDIRDNLEILIDRSERIETFARFTLRNVKRDKRNRKNVELNKVVSQVFSYFEKSLKERNIDVSLILPQKVTAIKAFQIDWESIIVNLITNALWALQDTEASKRRIRVSMQEAEGHIEIAFADSGFGIPAELLDKIFLPTFSTKRNEKGEVVGTGMGLTIVRDFVESYDGGSIRVESPSDLGGAEFCIKVKAPLPVVIGREEKG